MSGKVVGKEDIFKGGNAALFDDFNKSAEAANTTIKALETTINGLKVNLGVVNDLLKNNGFKNSKDIADFNKLQKQTAETAKAIQVAEQAKIKTERDLIALENAKAKATEAATKATQKQTAETAKATKEAEKQRKEQEKANDVYEQTKRKYEALSKAQIALNLNGRTGGIVYKGVKQELDQLLTSLNKAEQASGKFGRVVGQYPKNAFSTITSFIGKLPGGKEAAEGIEKLKGMAEGFHKSGESAEKAAQKLGLFSHVAGEIGGVGAGGAAVVGIGGAAAAAVTLMGTAFFRTAEGAAVMNTAVETVKGGFIGLLSAFNPFGDAFGHFIDSTVSGVKAGYDLAKLQNNEIRILAELTKQQQQYNEQKIKQTIVLNDATQSINRQKTAVQILTENQLKSNEATLQEIEYKLKEVNAEIAKNRKIGAKDPDVEKKLSPIKLEQAQLEKEINDLRTEGLAIANEGELKLLELKVQQKEAVLGLELAEINGEATLFNLRANNDALNFETRKAYLVKEQEARIKANDLELHDAREILALVAEKQKKTALTETSKADLKAQKEVAEAEIKRLEAANKFINRNPYSAKDPNNAQDLQLNNKQLELRKTQLEQITSELNREAGLSKEELVIQTKIAQLEANRKIQLEQNKIARENLAITEFQELTRLSAKTKAFQDEQLNKELNNADLSYARRNELNERLKQANLDALDAAQAAADKAFKGITQTVKDAEGKEIEIPVKIDFKKYTNLPIEQVAAAITKDISKLRLASGVEQEVILFLKSLAQTAENSAKNLKELNKELADVAKKLEDLRAKNITALDLKTGGDISGGDAEKFIENRIALERYQADTLENIQNLENKRAIEALRDKNATNFELVKRYNAELVQEEIRHNNQLRLNEIDEVKKNLELQNARAAVDTSIVKLVATETIKNKKNLAKTLANAEIKDLKEKIAREEEARATLRRLGYEDLSLNQTLYEDRLHLYELEQAKRKKRDTSIIQSLSNITSLVGEELQRRADLENKFLDKNVDKRKDNVDQQLQLAVAGRDNQLAFEKEQLAKAELAQKEALQRQARQQEAVKLAEAFLSNLNQKLSAGESYGQAAAESIAEIFAAKAIAATIAGAMPHFEGTEGSKTLGEMHGYTNTRDGHLIRADDDERIFNPGHSDMLGAMTNEEIARMAMDYQAGRLLPNYAIDIPAPPASFAENIGNSIIVQELKQLKEQHGKLLKAIADKPSFDPTEFDRWGNAITTRWENGIKKKEYMKSKPNLRGGF